MGTIVVWERDLSRVPHSIQVHDLLATDQSSKELSVSEIDFERHWYVNHAPELNRGEWPSGLYSLFQVTEVKLG